MNVLWRNHCFRENVISITYSKYVPVVLGMQQAMCTRHIFICGLSDLPYFSTLSHKWHDFRKTVVQHNMCVLIVSTTFVRNVSYSKNNSARHHNCSYVGLHVKYTLLLSDFNESWNSSTDIGKIHKFQILRKTVQWEPTRSCGRTDRYNETSSRFSQFYTLPKRAVGFSALECNWLLETLI
jgi:uncharacterized protein YozE (UPF0346 family)